MPESQQETRSNGPDPAPCTVATPATAACTSIPAPRLQPLGFRKIVVLAGAPDPSIHNANVLLTHEFDRNDTLANVTSVLRQYQRQSALYTSPADTSSSDHDLNPADESVTVERVSLKAWPVILKRLIAMRDVLLASAGQIASDANGPSMLVFNLCDGCDELDGYPGESVPRDLEENGFAFTGSMAEFYRITTPKTLLKSYLQLHSVPTSDFVPIRPDHLAHDVHGAIARLGFPLIIKPSISYASLGITSSSVTHTLPATLAQVAAIFAEFPRAGVFIERFLAGREFTAVVTGDAAGHGANVKVYPVAERAFRKDLKPSDRFLAFDRYWAGWTIDGDRPDGEVEAYYSYRLAPGEWQEELMRIAEHAYVACNGSGYGRVDFRTASADACEAYVLEVNANCGLTFDETSSLGEILRLSKVAPLTFLHEIIDGAVSRWSATCAESAANTMSADAAPAVDAVANALSDMDVNKPAGSRTGKREDSVLGNRQNVAETVNVQKRVADGQGAGV